MNGNEARHAEACTGDPSAAIGQAQQINSHALVKDRGRVRPAVIVRQVVEVRFLDGEDGPRTGSKYARLERNAENLITISSEDHVMRAAGLKAWPDPPSGEERAGWPENQPNNPMTESETVAETLSRR